MERRKRRNRRKRTKIGISIPKPDELREKLETSGYFLDKKTSVALSAALSTKPARGAFLFGPPGAGKTFLAETIASVFRAPLFVFQSDAETRRSDVLVRFEPNEDSLSGLRKACGALIKASEASEKGPTVLLLDEWDKGRPEIDSLLLRYLQDGRIEFPGINVRALLENLVVFVISNEERDLSEPLMRRLARVDLKPPSPALVRKALERSHAGNRFIPAAVKLYKRWLAATNGIGKPITIQELRQLIDAAELLGEDADWDTLIYTLTTKNREIHGLVARSDPEPVNRQDESRGEIDASDFDGDEDSGLEYDESARDDFKPRMPNIRRWAVPEVTTTPPETEVPITEEDAEKSYGIGRLNEDVYDAVARKIPLGQRMTGPYDFGDFADVKDFSVILRKPFDVNEIEKIEAFTKNGNKVSVVVKFPRVLKQKTGTYTADNFEVSAFPPRRMADIFVGRVGGKYLHVEDKCVVIRYKTAFIRFIDDEIEMVSDEIKPFKELKDLVDGNRDWRYELGFAADEYFVTDEKKAAEKKKKEKAERKKREAEREKSAEASTAVFNEVFGGAVEVFSLRSGNDERFSAAREEYWEGVTEFPPPKSELKRIQPFFWRDSVRDPNGGLYSPDFILKQLSDGDEKYEEIVKEIKAISLEKEKRAGLEEGRACKEKYRRK